MKALILFLISLWMGTLPFYAKDGNTSSTTTTTDTEESEKKKIPLHVKDTKDKVTYSLVQPTAYACLYDKVVSVDLGELPGILSFVLPACLQEKKSLRRRFVGLRRLT